LDGTADYKLDFVDTYDLQMACDGRFTAGHAQLCRLHLDAYDLLTGQIATLDQLVAAAAPFGTVIGRLVTIPGIGQRIVEVIVAETGGDMARFASSTRLAAWAGLAPADNESGGKRKKAAARKGNLHLRSAMVEAAWACARQVPAAPDPHGAVRGRNGRGQA
jgi:transposase